MLAVFVLVWLGLTQLVLAADANASGKKCLCKPGDPALARMAGRAVWVLEVPRDGLYHFWARLRAPSREEDSFYIRLYQDTGRFQRHQVWHTGVHRSYRWVQIPPASPSQLTAGQAFLEIHTRETGTKLDALAFSNDAAWKPQEKAARDGRAQ